MTSVTYFSIDRSGPNQWRDSQTPRQILEYWCELNNLNKPQYLGNTQLVLDGKVYNLQEHGKEFFNSRVCSTSNFSRQYQSVARRTGDESKESHHLTSVGFQPSEVDIL